MTFSNNTSVRIEYRYFIGTVPGTVLTSDTAWIIMPYDPVIQLDVAFCRTATQTFRINTVVATHRVEELESIGEGSCFHFTHTPPLDIRTISILFVTGYFAAVTSYTGGSIEVKAVLFSGFELWNIDGIATTLHTGFILVVNEAL